MLTPEEIQSREFLVSLRGYDRDEVHAFLGRVAEQLAQTEAKASQLQQRLDRLKAQQGSAPAEAAAAAPPAAASPEPSAMFAEIGKETQRILEAAQEAGQQIQRKARQEADRDLQSARTQAAKLIAEGERRREHIERIVSELEQSRAAMSVQLRGVGRTIEQTLKELASDSGGSTTVREALGAQAEQDAAAANQAEGVQEPAAGEASQAPADVEVSAAQEQDAAPEVAPSSAESTDDPEPAPETREADADPQADAAPPADDAPPAEEELAPAPEAAGDNAPDGGAAAVVDDSDAHVETAAPAATEPAMPPERSSAASTSGNDPQGLRAAALSPLHPKLVRKVKRELQEIQNIALDKVRRSRGKGEVEEFLPVSDDTVGLGEGAQDLLRQAWEAGVAGASALVERPLETPAETPELASMFREDATERVRSGLAATLKMGLSAEESSQELSDRIGSVFSDFKGAQSEELAATHLIRAYEQGLLGAWAAGGISARRWVMGREPRCPEGRCRQNDQSGPVAVTQAFPSGHDVPPVHVGCTCTTVPAEESSA